MTTWPFAPIRRVMPSSITLVESALADTADDDPLIRSSEALEVLRQAGVAELRVGRGGGQAGSGGSTMEFPSGH